MNEGHRTGLPPWSLPSRAAGEIRHPRDTTTGKQWCREGIPEEAGPTRSVHLGLPQSLRGDPWLADQHSDPFRVQLLGHYR